MMSAPFRPDVLGTPANLRSGRLQAAVLVIGLVCAPVLLAAPIPRVVTVRIGAERLKGLLEGGGLVFPSLWVYNGKRQLVFRFEGEHKDLVSALSQAWADPQPIAGPPLTRWISYPELGLIKLNSKKKEWIFVETWASWDPACRQEKRVLISFLTRHAAHPVELLLVKMGVMGPIGPGPRKPEGGVRSVLS